MAVDLHLSQAVFLSPAIEILRNAGAPVDRMLGMSGLDKFRIEEAAAAIPLTSVHTFFESVSRQEVGSHVPKAIAQEYKLCNLDHWGLGLLACADVLTACQLASHPEARLTTDNNIEFTIDGSVATFKDQYTTPRSAGQEWVALLSIFITFDGFRTACGPDWLPMELDIAASDIAALDQAVDLSGVVVRTDQPANQWRFRTGDLANRMPAISSETGALRPFLSTTQGRVIEILDALQPDVMATQERIASFLDMAPRTLQRRLAEEGATFFELIDRWRMGRATTLLENTRLPVSEVAARLHYSNSSHFSRAFRRWTGNSPAAYRDALGF